MLRANKTFAIEEKQASPMLVADIRAKGALTDTGRRLGKNAVVRTTHGHGRLQPGRGLRAHLLQRHVDSTPALHRSCSLLSPGAVIGDYFCPAKAFAGCVVCL